MGIQGLRKFIDGQSCTSTVAPDVKASVDHVLFDTNSLVHRCYAKDDTPMKTIEKVVQRLKTILTETITPKSSVTLAFDGPAPVAKLRTQRLRRRKTQHLDVANNSFFSDLAITAGSRFMVQLENVLARELAMQFDGTGVKVFVFGTTVIGEGEFKISQALAGLATRHDYDANETVVVVGNDIDLTLTCFGATCFHNLCVMSPSSGEVIDIGLILMRWLQPGVGFVFHPHSLASARIDLCFLFLLNGGDHYTGLGEAAVEMWKKYRMLKAQQPRLQIVGSDLMSLDVRVLAQLLNAEQYTGDADADAGRKLLQAALWSCCACVSGTCLDYQFLVGDDVPQPSMSMLRAAVADGRPIALHRTRYRDPLTPLGTFVALMPRVDLMPEAIKTVLLQNQSLCERLLAAMDAREVVRLVREVLSTASPSLSTLDKAMNCFTNPVRVQLQLIPEEKEANTQGRKRGGRRLSVTRKQNHRDYPDRQQVARDIRAQPVTTEELVTPRNFCYHALDVIETYIFRNPFRSSVNQGIKVFRFDGKQLVHDNEHNTARKSKRKIRRTARPANDDEVEIDESEWINEDGPSIPTVSSSHVLLESTLPSKRKRQ